MATTAANPIQAVQNAARLKAAIETPRAEPEQPQRDRHDGADLQSERDEVQRFEDLLAIGGRGPALARQQLRQRGALNGLEHGVHHTPRRRPASTTKRSRQD